MATTQSGVMTKERYAQSTSFDEYASRMKVNKDTMIQFLEEVQISDEHVQWWKSQGTVNAFVMTYDGCGDALYNIPVLAKISKLCPNVNLHVVQRDEYLDIMDKHLNQGIYRSVPCMVFYDEHFNEIANLKERPENLSRIIDLEQIAIRRRLREENKVPWRDELARELKDVVGNHKMYP